MVSAISVPQEQDAERFFEVELQGLLPDNCVLTCDRDQRLVTLLCMDDQQKRRITEQQLFSDQEFDFLCHLLESYPDYAPLADLYSLQSGRGLQ